MSPRFGPRIVTKLLENAEVEGERDLKMPGYNADNQFAKNQATGILLVVHGDNNAQELDNSTPLEVL